MPGFGNGKFENAIISYFPFKQIFSNSVVSEIASVTVAASAAGASLSLSTFSGDLVPVDVTGSSVSISGCLKDEDISFVLFRSMC